MRRLNVILTLSLLSLSPTSFGQYFGDLVLGDKTVNENQLRMVGEVQQQILRNTKNSPPHDPVRLATAFVASASKYGLDARLLAAIGAVESGYFVAAVNKRSNDFGLMQVNVYNVKSLKLSKTLLVTDIEYSIDAGARILKYFKDRFEREEPRNWFARYNCGTGKWRRVCDVYASKVRRFL